MATHPITDLLAELEILAFQALDFGANSTTSRLEFSTGSINSGEESLGQQTCTSWPIMTNLVYRDGRDLGRGEFPFIHYRQTCTDGIGEALIIGKPILEESSQGQKRPTTQILTVSDPKIRGQDPKTLVIPPTTPC